MKERLVSRGSWARRCLVLLALGSLAACVTGSVDLGQAVGVGSGSSAGAGPSGGSPSGGSGVLGHGGSGSTNAGGSSGSPVVMPGGGNSSTGGMTQSNGGTTSLPACNFPAWVAHQSYKAGDKVMYMAKAFIASHDNDGLDPIIRNDFWDPFACHAAGGGGATGAGGSTGVGGSTNNGDCALAKYLPQGQTSFDNMFQPPWAGHVAKPLYAYSALCEALKTKGFTSFANSGNAETDKREIAAFFAHVAKETAFLEQSDENGQPSTAADYHGRGAIQITGQSNYQAAGQYLGKDLNGNPGLVSTDAVTNWQTALWFWMVNYNTGTPGVQNCHQAISAGDFGQTTRIINGGIECPGSDSAKQRAGYFTNNCSTLSVAPGSALVC